MIFAGPSSAALYASSSAQDTDWFITLSEIGQDEKIFQLVQGKIRARFRSSMKASELLEPNRIYQYDIDLWHTGICIPTGGRLRVEIASASFPRYFRNLNTGGHNEIETNYVAAQQTIYHNLQRPSYILLPIIHEQFMV
jgi:putative CocE/NonD family hydrolase